ncbi:hypothetical protein HDU79_007472 [Rhizoclosmatium sp. JEL0117]|nr:hypothetical protein HDU79_007472 [Rhizoclosmatium sp. JEL0117]
MRLLTHNMLMCHVKGCATDNFPLRIEDAELEQVEVEFNEDFMRRMINKIEWGAFVQTAFALGVDQLPATVPENIDTEFLQRIHKVAMETKLKEGKMICNGCKHVYPVTDGIPNMLLQETEV